MILEQGTSSAEASELPISGYRLCMVELGKVQLESADKTQKGNLIYLVSNPTGIGAQALDMLALSAPVIVMPIPGAYAAVGNLRTLSILKTVWPEGKPIPVIVIENGGSNNDWNIFDTMVGPLLQALNPSTAADQLDEIRSSVPKEKLSEFLKEAQTTSGLAKLMKSSRVKLCRSQKATRDMTVEQPEQLEQEQV